MSPYRAHATPAAALGAVVLGIACAGGRAPAPERLPAPDPERRDECLAEAAPTAPPDTLVVALRGGIDPIHTPVPGPEAERLVFDQMYAHLLQVDCRGPALAFHRWPGSDSRDPLDSGADLLVTDDPSALAYAATLPAFTSVPLPWDRTYVLVVLGPGPAAMPDSSLRRELARDAVRVEARAAEAPYWWEERACTGAAVGSAPGRTPARIVYAREDGTARDLAERLVVVGTLGPLATAAALSTAEFDEALRRGAEAAYVLALPRQPPPGCDRLADWPAGLMAVPLIDVRQRAIVRRGLVGLSLDADGRLHLEPR